MRASRSEIRARVASSSWIGPVTWLALLMLLALSTARSWAKDPPRPPAPPDSGGFNVRVVEEGSPQTRAERARQEAERAQEAAREAMERALEEARAAERAGVPVPPEPPDIDIDIDANDNNVVRFGEDITIHENQVIDGDVVAIGGSVTVLGRVTGDAVAVGGKVEIKGKGVVEGDAVAMGGGVSTSDSGAVAGSNVSLGGIPGAGHGAWFWPMVGAVGSGMWVFFTIIKLALLALFAWLALLLIRERMTLAVDEMGQHFGRSFLWGLLGWAAMVVVIPTVVVVLILVGAIAIAILAITIIGIPLAILLVVALVLAIIGIVVAAAIAAFVGFLNGAMFLGRRVLGGTTARARGPLLAIMIGLALFMVLDLAGRLLGFVGVVLLQPISIAIGIAVSALAFILTSAGFGAMILTRFASGPRGEGALGTQWWPSSRRRSPAADAAPAAASSAPSGLAGAEAPPPQAPPSGGSSDAP